MVKIFKSRITQGLALWVILAATPTVWADLRFAESAVDVGEVRSGAPLTHRFAFVNEGPEEVEITGLRASCGCMKPRLEQRKYGLGEKGALVLDVHTLGEVAGDHTWQLAVAYRCGSTLHEATLDLRGRVITEIVVQPPSLTLYTLGNLGHQLTLTDLRERPLTVVQVRTTSPGVKAQVTQTGQDLAGHRQITVGLRVEGTCPNGRYEEVVSLLTDDNTYPELRVPVTVVKRSRQRVSASPASVTIQAAPGQALPSRIVLLRPGGEEAVGVNHVETDDPAVVCTWAAGPENLATLKISINRDRLPANGLRSAVHVHLDKPVSEVLTIPVVSLTE
jgi:hypothetical protein